MLGILKISNILIFGGLFLILLVGGLAINEYFGAKSFCDSQNSTISEYELRIYIENNTNNLKIKHFCGLKQIFKYTDGWDYNKSTDFLIQLPTKG